MNKTFLLIAFVLAALTILIAADISGKWQAEFDTQIGRQKYVYTFRIDGDRVIGTAEAEIMSEKRKTDLKDIKLVAGACSTRAPSGQGFMNMYSICMKHAIRYAGETEA